jgi:hypothetical protein
VGYEPAFTLVMDGKANPLADFHMIMNEQLELYKSPAIDKIPAGLEIKSRLNTGTLIISQFRVFCLPVCCLKT